jgi:signal transduction histidine kinase
MRTLFGKILLWFVATTAVTFIGLVVIPAISLTDPARRPPFSNLFSFQADQAERAYETGGREALAGFLGRLKTYVQSDLVLADANGRDLMTGEDRSQWIAAGRERFWFRRFVGRPRAIIAHTSMDGRYWLIIAISQQNARRWVFLPGQLWILVVGILLCYLLALYLTSPLRSIEKALERFGKGDFSARIGSKRRDELGHLARTFDQMAERIQTLVAADRRLLLDISHELRSPLARLGVAVELARSGEDRESALNRIQKESDRLNALVGELLQVTRAEVDPNSLHREPVRLDELLADIVDDCSVEAQDHCNLSLLSPEPVTVSGDEEMLRRALENILRNAIRFAPEKTAVEVSLHPNGASATVQIRDYGSGVPEEALQRIFDPFYRVESDRNRSRGGGVGLGLAIARRAVELHKGKLSARNSHPGLQVEVELPTLSTLSETSAPKTVTTLRA